MLTDQANIPDTAIWNEETGETFGQARARFATFGPPLTAREALNAVSGKPESLLIMSFGYGDDPDGFTSVDRDDLFQSFVEDGEAVDGYWGPFALVDEAVRT